VGQSSAAVTATGMTATVTASGSGSTVGSLIQYQVTVTNGTANPASNWQVAFNLNNSAMGTNTSVNNAEKNVINGQAVFSPLNHASPVAAGGTASFSFSATTTSLSNFTPTIATVDGVANGTYGVGTKATGVDAIAQAAATGALNVAVAYENNKPASNGDSKYLQYDNLILSSQAYVISTSGSFPTIVFDSNLPGYSFIPSQAQAELAFLQQNASVAAYLVDGLASCFNGQFGVRGTEFYNFRAGILKGYTAGTTTTGSLNGVIPMSTAYTPSGYNVNNVVDKFTTVGQAKGASTFTSTLTSTSSPTSAEDYWFGILTMSDVSAFNGSTGNTTAILAKYAGSNGTGNIAACSPFNGPGGTSNPSFIISINGQQQDARFQGEGAQCQNACSSTLVMDPVAYMTPGVQYDASGYELGPQINPFSLNPASMYAISQNDAMWAIETSGGVQSWGQFTTPVTLFGVTKYQFVDQGAIPPGTTFDP
jgi:hypothetical protein